MEDCAAPVGCDGVVLSAINNCKFNTTDFGAGVPCLTCKPGYYLTSDSHCNGIGIAVMHMLPNALPEHASVLYNVHPGIEPIFELYRTYF